MAESRLPSWQAMMSIAEDMAAWVADEAAREAREARGLGLGGSRLARDGGSWRADCKQARLLEVVGGISSHPEAAVCWVRVVRAWLEAWASAFTEEFVRAANAAEDLSVWVPDDDADDRITRYVDAAVDECLREQLWPGILTERELEQVRTLVDWLQDGEGS